MTLWLDRDLRPARSQVELPGLGKVVFLRASREIATSEDGRVATVADIGISQLVWLNRRIPRAHDTRSVVYRITVKGDDDPASAFARDDRQKIENVKGSSFEMRVRAIREAPSEGATGQPKSEFLESNSFVNSEDARVKQHARSAVGGETDPWKKAVRIERWVHNHIVDKNFTEALATADEVARTLEGDCTEHAVLTAAMCRAEGVPARLAVGLVYVESRGMPSMGFHMWTEVWIKGQWLAIDSTLARGSIGAAHIKVFDHSWHDVSAVTTPLLAMTRVVGKVSIEVLSIDGD
jgi:transglutaminase-like putative cysteine protease